MELKTDNGGNVSQIILDISANTHKNDDQYYKFMINELAKVDTHKHDIVLKWQLFEYQGDNEKADVHTFQDMARWAWVEHRYKTTASVFDIESLNRLIYADSILPYDLPFIKIANRQDLYWLVGEIPRKYRVLRSVSTLKEYYDDKETPLFCVSEYPARIGKYPYGVAYISDHTSGLCLWYRNKPSIWEKHYKMSDSTGLDAGCFAITPEELKEIL